MKQTYAQMLEDPNRFKTCVECGRMQINEMEACFICHKKKFIPGGDFVKESIALKRTNPKFEFITDDEFLSIEYTVSPY